MASPTTITSIIRGAQQIDPIMWTRLSEVYGPLVYSWARNAGLQERDAEDVGQEVFMTVYQRLPEFTPGSFRGWLRTIARNKIGDWLRRRARQIDIPKGGTTDFAHAWGADIDAHTTSITTCSVAEEHSVLRRSIEVVRGEFTEKTWQAFWRTVVEGHDSSQVAEEIGMSPQAVRNARYKVIRRIKQLLDA